MQSILERQPESGTHKSATNQQCYGVVDVERVSQAQDHLYI